jgi:N-acetylglucosamine-6-phosphate deacetylase
MDSYVLAGASAVLPSGVVPNAAVAVEEGVITYAGPQDGLGRPKADLAKLPSDSVVVPGFIDTHIHGCMGADVMDAAPDSLALISKTLLGQGVTAWLPTTMSQSSEAIEQALQAVDLYARDERSSEGASVLGVHLEGPFISKEKRGAHDPAHIAPPSVQSYERWSRACGGRIRQMTLAPELPGALDLIRRLARDGVVASVGHANCAAAVAAEAFEAGATKATHLYNAMSGLERRRPGAAAAVLLSEHVAAEMIVDGVHLSPEIVRLTVKVLGKDRIVLITDAMRGQGLGQGHFDLGGLRVVVKDNEARLADGTLAGSVLDMNRAVANMVRFTGCELTEASAMASANPARVLGLDHVMGTIEVGKLADLTVLGPDLQVVQTRLGSGEAARRLWETIQPGGGRS